MNYTIEYYDDDIITQLLAQPISLQANFISLAQRMKRYGVRMVDATPKHYEEVFELCFFEPKGWNRVIFMAQIDWQIVILHIVVQKTAYMPWREKGKAAKRMKELRFG
ncbi:TPA: type II toxin-antitoxin system RelE/ParE family toxin [Yersinia enterocolitica]|nr:type II toxin-antitoxin system RelE/ParE family toxin [Yersinia enterocolitica]